MNEINSPKKNFIRYMILCTKININLRKISWYFLVTDAQWLHASIVRSIKKIYEANSFSNSL